VPHEHTITLYPFTALDIARGTGWPLGPWSVLRGAHRVGAIARVPPVTASVFGTIPSRVTIRGPWEKVDPLSSYPIDTRRQYSSRRASGVSFPSGTR
jgi:hypothetical protein